MENTFFKDIVKFFTNRLFIMSVVFCVLFYLIAAQLFDLQIVKGEEYLEGMRYTNVIPQSLPAPRGTVYDRLGRPLAVNESAFLVKIDPSVTVEEPNTVFYGLIKLFEKNGEEYVDEFPIELDDGVFSFTIADNRAVIWKKDMAIDDPNNALDAEMTFIYLRAKFLDSLPITVSEGEIKFTGSDSDVAEWKTEMGIDGPQAGLNARDTLLLLRERPRDMDDYEARKLLNFLSMVYLKRFKRDEQITVAYDVSDATVAALEEGNVGQESRYSKYPGVYVDTGSLRRYPAGKYFAHILGYTGRISEDKLAELTRDGSEAYNAMSIVGRAGLESTLERDLKGVDGVVNIEVNLLNRRLGQVGEPTDPIPGNKVFLTMDLDLQSKLCEILEATLRDAQKAKLQGLGRNEEPITLKQLFKSMVTSNNIPVRELMAAEEGSYTANIKQYVLDTAPESLKAVFASEEPLTSDVWAGIQEGVKEVVNAGIESGRLSPVQMILTLHELGVITGSEDYLARIKSGNISPLNVILEKLDSGEITPKMTCLDPCTASAVLVEANTGKILAAATYPTYDNNELVNNMNAAYYNALNADTYTSPLTNRPFREPRAPGSTFKMITAVTGLETGVITPTTTIYDGHTFTAAGEPYTNCWSAVSHGLINVAGALECSCNYFFCETAYRIGNSKSGNKLGSINALNDYMEYFGLNRRTGVEIGELYDDAYYTEAPSVISSPEFKVYKINKRYSEPTALQSDWYDGDTVKTAIGQADNNYTAASMAKYIATIATRGTRYQFHLVDRVETQQGELVRRVEPVVEDNSNVTVSEETWDVIHQGMRQVIEGRGGTGRTAFADFPVKVAGKTGTAEEDKSRDDHSSFGGFAPYDDPQIAVYVTIPYGDTRAYPSAASQVAKKIIAEYMGLDSQPQTAAAPNALAQ